MTQLSTWDNFYVIIGSAGASLTGLMFVVITLSAQSSLRRSGEILGAFSTPSVVHFCSALGVAAIVCAPWQALWQPGLLLGLAGLSGMLYVRIVIRRMRRQTDYAPVLEDVLWHMVLPLVCYSVLLIAALVLAGNPTPALFLVGAATVLLVFIGIHNAWDNVTYVVLTQSSPEQPGEQEHARAEAGEGPTPG
ncbi:MAG TPA: hypothetical protein VHB98_24700 [Chloroflexota bacterium]|nr:hypothetical protein [Chloroflexota bacterium]